MSTQTPAEAPRLSTLHVGTIGHEAHGKTTLTAAISGLLAARPGARFAPTSYTSLSVGAVAVTDDYRATVRAAFVQYDSEQRHYVHRDCPGRRQFFKSFQRTVASLDAAILVVSAFDSVMAQTREHLIAARSAGITRVVVFINKCDLVTDPDTLDMVESETRMALVNAGLEGDDAPVVRGSTLHCLKERESHWCEGISNLVAALDH